MNNRSSQKSSPTVAASLERKIALEILRGQHAPGTQLPPVRSLATELGVTVPTIQRVVDRLEATGLVSVRRGSGVRVNDPEACGELTLLPLWFEALSDQPARAAGMLSDFLELRRVLAVHLVRSRSQEIEKARGQLLQLAARLQVGESVAEVADADLAFTAALAAASGQFAARAVFHTSAALVREVPQVAEAIYGDRGYHKRVLGKIVAALQQRADPEQRVAELERLLGNWDRRTVSRFRERLEE